MKLSVLSHIASGINQKRHPQGNVYYLQARDFIKNDLLDSNLKPSIVDYPKLESHYLKKGDVLILSKGHHGFNAFVYKEHKAPAVASSIFLVLKKIDTKILPEFLVWYVNLESTQQQLIGSSRGSALPSINKKILSNLEIPVPELHMQQDIIALSKLKQEESKLIEQIDMLKSKALEINLKERIQY